MTGALRAIVVGVVVCLAADAAVWGETPAARCFRLIALFDEVVVSSIDHRLLRIEDFELAEALERRRQAGAYCATGRWWFGIQAIEDALDRIGVSPVLGAGEDPADGR